MASSGTGAWVLTGGSNIADKVNVQTKGTMDNDSFLDIRKQQVTQAHETGAKRIPHWSDHFYKLRPRSHSLNDNTKKNADLIETMSEAAHASSSGTVT